jgi:hypothetical protein
MAVCRRGTLYTSGAGSPCHLQTSVVGALEKSQTAPLQKRPAQTTPAADPNQHGSSAVQRSPLQQLLQTKHNASCCSVQCGVVPIPLVTALLEAMPLPERVPLSTAPSSRQRSGDLPTVFPLRTRQQPAGPNPQVGRCQLAGSWAPSTHPHESPERSHNPGLSKQQHQVRSMYRCCCCCCAAAGGCC